MNKSLKVLATVSVISVIGGTTLFAAPKANESEKIQAVELRAPGYETISMSGVIKVNEKKGVRIVSIQLDNGKTYILSNDPTAPAPLPEGFLDNAKSDGSIKSDKKEYTQDFENLPFMGKKYQRVTMDDLASKKGQHIRVSGYFNRESGVFTVIKYGRLDGDAAKDAK